MGYNRCMIDTPLPPVPVALAEESAPDPALLLEQFAPLREENAALRAQNTVPQQRIRALEVQLGPNPSNSSRPPSSDPPHVRPKQRAAPSGRKRGGHPGHRAAFRALLPGKQVDGVVAVVPERCRHCQQPFAEPAGHQARVWRHQVAELLPLFLWPRVLLDTGLGA
jgi:transposase